MRIQDIARTIARTRLALPALPRRASPALSRLGLVLVALVASGSCRGGCARKVDPAATVQGRLALLPEPVRIVVSIDVARLRRSPVAGKLSALGKQTPEDDRALEELKRRTGLDPLEQIDSVLVGFPADARQRGELALVLRAQHLDQTRLVAYVRDQLQKKGDDLTSAPRGRFTLWSARHDPGVAGFFVDDQTFVLGAGGWAPRLADLAETARPGDSAATNIDLSRLVDRAAEHALWAAAIVPAETRRALQADPRLGAAASLMNLVVGIDLARGMDAVVIGDVATTPDAQSLAAKMQETLRDAKRNAQILMLGLGPYLDGVTVRSSDQRFELRAALAEPQVDDLVARLGAFLTLARQGHAPGFP
jgi:hypothetical protein